MTPFSARFGKAACVAVTTSVLFACNVSATKPAGELAPAAAVDANGAQVSGLTARHRAGQTILTWKEIEPLVGDSPTLEEVRQLRIELQKTRRLRYRIYRSTTPIASIEGLTPIAEVLPLTAWNLDYHGAYPRAEIKPARYVVDEGKGPVPLATGIYAYNPPEAAPGSYAVTAVIDGRESSTITAANALQAPVKETVGPGAPILQRTETFPLFNYIESPTLRYYVRWETAATSSVPGKPFDYVIGLPHGASGRAPVGLHLHAWAGTLNEGYGWWFNAAKGSMLVATNQDPYDWWTGYHEFIGTGRRLETPEDWRAGVVRPFTQRRLLAILDWVNATFDVDTSRTFVGGLSMGGSGSLMLAIRYPERFAWAVSWVGIHVPAESPTYKSSYDLVYGLPEWGVRYEDGTPAWEYFDDAAYLRRHPDRHIPFVTFSNGKNDTGIGWPQAVKFLRALQDTRQPHLFVWGQQGHSQRAMMPRAGGEQVMPLDLRVAQSVPAFTQGSLDDNPGDGQPESGAPTGQVNLYLDWDPDDIVDTPERWEMTVRVIDAAPREACTVDLTPRRAQQFKLAPGERVTWASTPRGARQAQQGTAIADEWGLVTIERLAMDKRGTRVQILRAPLGTETR